MKRVMRLTCMSCGSLQRLKVDVDTEDASGIPCYDCGPTTWMSLPTIRPIASTPRELALSQPEMFSISPLEWLGYVTRGQVIHYRWEADLAEEDDE